MSSTSEDNINYTISLREVTKAFARSGRRNGYSTIKSALLSLFSKKKSVPVDETVALKSLTMRVPEGSSVGVIGRNGSGKSTLLKLITGIYKPSSGEIDCSGRVSALIELGAGFHPDFTGRENVFLGGMIQGLTKKQIHDRFDEIVEFAELENFIDEPVRTYSSGMFMRLAFSVAIHVLPEILFIDEILAVGDQSFQDKCFHRLYQLKREGVTMIIVSHDLRSLQSICDRLIWIHLGEVKMTGEPRQVLASYTDFMRKQNEAKMIQQSFSEVTGQRWGSGEIRFRSVRLVDKDGNPTTMFKANEPMSVCMEWEATEPIDNPQFGLSIYRTGDQVQLNSPTTEGAGIDLGMVEGSGEISYHVDTMPLLPGVYHLNVSIHDKMGIHTFDYIDKCQKIEITYTDIIEHYGFLSLPARWEIK